MASTAVNRIRTSISMSLLAVVFASAYLMAEFVIFWSGWVFGSFLASVFFLVFSLCLPLAVLLTSLSVYLVAKSAREQLTALPPSPRASAEAAIKTEVIAAGTTLEDELKRYEEHLAKLEELRRSGQVSEEVYQTLKGEYTAKIEELRKKVRAFR